MTNAQLFSETQGRYIISVKDGQSLDVNQAIEIGQLTSDGTFEVSNSEVTISKKVSDIKHTWEGAIAQCLTTQD